MPEQKPQQPGEGHGVSAPFRFEKTLPASTTAMDEALTTIMDGIERGAFPCGDLDEIRLALREALNNAVLHGSGGDASKQIHIACRCDTEKGLWVKIRDEGEGFDPDRVPDPTHPDNLDRLSGRGVYMIRRLMDIVEFHDSGREIHMSRRPTPIPED